MGVLNVQRCKKKQFYIDTSYLYLDFIVFYWFYCFYSFIGFIVFIVFYFYVFKSP